MSLKRIFLIVMLILVMLAGGYITFFGISGYVRYSGPEHYFGYLKSGDIVNDMLLKGEIETVTGRLGTRSIKNEAFGIQVSSSLNWHYYVLPFGYSADKMQQKYCVFAVTKNEDVKAVEDLLKPLPAPSGPNAPRFEFHGIAMSMDADIHARLSEYLWETYDTDFNIYNHAKVDRYIVPYTIYVRTGADGGLAPIIIGASLVLAGGGLLTLISVKTYRKNHMY